MLIKNFKNYDVNKVGEITNVKTGKVLKPVKIKGYHRVNLWNEQGRKLLRVHRLVAEAFLVNPDRLPQVDHIDDDKNNNASSNLRWCTNKQNSTWFSLRNPDVVKAGNTARSVVVDGAEFHSALAAAKYIIKSNPGKNAKTIAKEIKRRCVSNSETWIMYGKHSIGY